MVGAAVEEGRYQVQRLSLRMQAMEEQQHGAGLAGGEGGGLVGAVERLAALQDTQGRQGTELVTLQGQMQGQAEAGAALGRRLPSSAQKCRQLVELAAAGRLWSRLLGRDDWRRRGRGSRRRRGGGGLAELVVHLVELDGAQDSFAARCATAARKPGSRHDALRLQSRLLRDKLGDDRRLSVSAARLKQAPGQRSRRRSSGAQASAELGVVRAARDRRRPGAGGGHVRPRNARVEAVPRHVFGS
eukprot:COSAG02_NODE_7632_length_2925_cov_1.298655_1_plen_244_part_00